MVAKKQEVATTPDSTAVETTDRGWLDVDFQTAVDFCVQDYGQIISATDVIGDGFMQMDKGEAVGREFLIIDWRFIMDEKTNREYVNVRAINPHNVKFWFNDGSTGIYDQLKKLNDRGIRGGIMCPNGLRVSEYMHENPDGSKSAAKTYYISA